MPTPDLVAMWAPTNKVTDYPVTWVDVSSLLRKASTARGRQSELDNVQTGEMTLTLDNRDRAFDPANAAGPYYGNLSRGKPVRLAVGYRYHVDLSNPLSYLQLNEASGSTFTDMRALGNGTLVGSDIAYAAQGPLTALTTGAVTINGSGSTTAITQPHNAAYAASQNTVTVEAWVMMTASATHGIYAKGYTTGLGLRVTSAGAVTALLLSTGATIATTSGTPCSSQNGTTWYHIVYTKNGTGAGASHIYVNGVDQTLGTNAAATINDTAASAINWGREYASAGPTYGNYLRGRLAHVAVFAQAISSTEVAAHYASRTSPQAAIFTGMTDEYPQGFTGWDSTVDLQCVDATSYLEGVGLTVSSTFDSVHAGFSPWGWWRMREAKWPSGVKAMVTNDASGNRRHARHNNNTIALNQQPIVGASPSVMYPRTNAYGLHTSVNGNASQLSPPDPPFSVEMWVQWDDVPASKWVRNSTDLADPQLFLMMKPIGVTTYGLEIALGLRFDEPLNSGPSLCNALWVRYTDDPVGGDASGYMSAKVYTLQIDHAPYEQTAAPFLLFDGQPHQIVFTCDASFPGSYTNCRLYFDGTAYSVWGTSSIELAPMSGYRGNVWAIHWGRELGGRMSEVAVYPSQLSAANVTSLYNSGARSWGTHKAGAHAKTILDGAGWPAAQRDLDTGRTLQSMVNTAGKGAMDLLRLVEDTEGGLVHFDADGRLVLRDRAAFSSEAALTTPQVTFSDQRADVTSSTVHTYVSTSFSYNTARNLLRNVVEADAIDPSVDSYTAHDDTSIAALGAAGDSVKMAVQSRTDLVGAAETMVKNYAAPLLRFDPMIVFPDDRPATYRATGWQKLLELDIGYMVTAKRTPRVGAVISTNVRVRRIEHDITPKAWRVKMSVSTRQVTEAYWVLGTGALGTSTPLAW